MQTKAPLSQALPVQLRRVARKRIKALRKKQISPTLVYFH